MTSNIEAKQIVSIPSLQEPQENLVQKALKASREFAKGAISGAAVVYGVTPGLTIADKLSLFAHMSLTKQKKMGHPLAGMKFTDYYKGALWQAGGTVPAMAIQKCLYGLFNSAYGKDKPPQEIEKAIMAFSAGALSAFGCTPTDHISLLARQKGENRKPMEIFRDIKEKGLFKIWNGNVAAMGREGPFAVSYLFLSPFFQDLFKQYLDEKKAKPLAQASAGALALSIGTVGATLRTVKQLNTFHSGGPPSYWKGAQQLGLKNIMAPALPRAAVGAVAVPLIDATCTWLTKIGF